MSVDSLSLPALAVFMMVLWIAAMAAESKAVRRDESEPPPPPPPRPAGRLRYAQPFFRVLEGWRGVLAAILLGAVLAAAFALATGGIGKLGIGPT